MSCDCNVTCLFVVQKKIKKRKESKINIKSEKLNKRKEKLSVSKVFHNNFHHSSHEDTLHEVADSFSLELLTSINPVLTQYVDNSQDSNSVLDLMFL